MYIQFGLFFASIFMVFAISLLFFRKGRDVIADIFRHTILGDILYQINNANLDEEVSFKEVLLMIVLGMIGFIPYFLICSLLSCLVILIHPLIVISLIISLIFYSKIKQKKIK